MSGCLETVDLEKIVKKRRAQLEVAVVGGRKDSILCDNDISCLSTGKNESPRPPAAGIDALYWLLHAAHFRPLTSQRPTYESHAPVLDQSVPSRLKIPTPFFWKEQ